MKLVGELIGMIIVGGAFAIAVEGIINGELLYKSMGTTLAVQGVVFVIVCAFVFMKRSQDG